MRNKDKEMFKEALEFDMVCSRCGKWANPNYILEKIKLCDNCYKRIMNEGLEE